MVYYQPLVQYLFFKTPNQWLCSLSTKQERESEKVKCHINKKVFPEAPTLQSSENCVWAQLVHSSHIGECARNQSRPGPAVIRQTEGWGTHNNDPLACSARIFSRSASDSHINPLYWHDWDWEWEHTFHHSLSLSLPLFFLLSQR